MTDIRIEFSRFSAFYSPLIVTYANGYLQAEGFSPTAGVVPPGESAAARLADGTITVAQSAVSQGFMALEKGTPSAARHFAQINETDGFFIAAREPMPDFEWQSLAGKQVLVDHAGQPCAMFKYGCRMSGLDYDAINAVDAGSPADMEAAFRNGEGEFVHLQGPVPQQLEQDGVGHVVASVGAAIGACAFSSLLAMPDWIETDEAKSFMRAYRAARAFVIESSPEDVAKVIAPHFQETSAPALTKTIAAYQALGCWTPHIEITQAAYEAALDVFLNAGLITGRHDYDKVVVPPPSQAVSRSKPQ